MQYPLTDIQANFEINRQIRYQITTKRRTDGTLTIGSFFEKKKKITKNEGHR